jgi:hypothetical protein
LSIIEGPKALCFELKCTGNVQTLECSNSEFWAVPTAQVAAQLERSLGDFEPLPESSSTIIVEFPMHTVCFVMRHLLAKDLLRNRMCPLSKMERRNAWPCTGAQQLVGICRVSVSYIERDEEAGVGVNRQ